MPASPNRFFFCFERNEIPTESLHRLVVDLFAEDPINISLTFELFGQGRNVVVDGLKSFGAVVMWKSPGHPGLSAWLADSCIDVRLCELDPLLGEFVDVWSDAGHLATKGANGVVGEIIRCNEEDVRSRLRILVAVGGRVLEACQHQSQNRQAGN